MSWLFKAVVDSFLGSSHDEEAAHDEKDSVDVIAITKAERTARTIHQAKVKPVLPEGTRLLSAFFVVGLKDADSRTPEILFQWPIKQQQSDINNNDTTTTSSASTNSSTAMATSSSVASATTSARTTLMNSEITTHHRSHSLDNLESLSSLSSSSNNDASRKSYASDVDNESSDEPSTSSAAANSLEPPAILDILGSDLPEIDAATAASVRLLSVCARAYCGFEKKRNFA